MSTFDFTEARAAINTAKAAQASAEQAVRDAFSTYGNAERAYRKALAIKILELRAEGIPVTICLDLAKGDRRIADLRYARDVAEGVKEAATSAIWRHTADRRELEQLVDWSMRRDLAIDHGQLSEPIRFQNVTPRRVA